MRSICWGTRGLVVSNDVVSASFLLISTYLIRGTSLPFSFGPSLSTLVHSESQEYRQHAHAGRAQCLHTKRDDGTMFPCRYHQSQHAYRQSLRKLVHGRMSSSFCMRMYSFSNSRAMVPGECSRCDHSTRRLDLPLGSHCDSLDGSRSLHRKLHGMINYCNQRR